MARQQIHLWLDEETATALRAQAHDQGSKISTLADQALRTGLGLITTAQAETNALPAIEVVVRRVVAEQGKVDTERLAALLVKTCREASVARWLAYAAILRSQGRAVADADMERAFTAAAKVLQGKATSIPHTEAGKADA